MAVTFQAINLNKSIMEHPESQAAAIAASKVAADIALKSVAMGWGAKVDVTVKSQEDLPRWEDLPQEVRDAIDRLSEAHGT